MSSGCSGIEERPPGPGCQTSSTAQRITQIFPVCIQDFQHSLLDPDIWSQRKSTWYHQALSDAPIRYYASQFYQQNISCYSPEVADGQGQQQLLEHLGAFFRLQQQGAKSCRVSAHAKVWGAARSGICLQRRGVFTICPCLAAVATPAFTSVVFPPAQGTALLSQTGVSEE